MPVVTAPAQYTIPLRTPIALTGSATDADGDTLLYSWEQNDRGGTAGTSLLANTKTNGALFAMFPKSALITPAGTLMYDSPGENHLTTSPTRVIPDLQKIIDNNTNADTGACPSIQIAPPVPPNVKECFMEFLPTLDYVGFTGVNQSPTLAPHALHRPRLDRREQHRRHATAPGRERGPVPRHLPEHRGEARSERLVADGDVGQANTDIAPVSTAT